MPRTLAGIYQKLFTAINGQIISPTQFNAQIDDIGSELTKSVNVTGTAVVLADIPMNSKTFTGLRDGALAQDAITIKQVQSRVLSFPTGITGTVDATVLTYAPALTVYPANFEMIWRSLGPNTVTNPTVKGDTLLAALTIVKPGAVALRIGELGPLGTIIRVFYDGTNAVVSDVSEASVNGDNVFTGNNTHSGTETFNGITALAGASSFANNTAAVFNGSAVSREQALVVTTGNAAWPMISGPDANVILTGTTNLSAPTGQAIGQKGQLRITQDATGGRVMTFDVTYVTDRQLVPSIFPGLSIDTVFNYWVKAASGAGSIVLTPRTESTPTVIIEDQQASGTAAQAPTSGVDTQVRLNTLMQNYGGLATLATNQFTLPAGTYFMNFSGQVNNSTACRYFLHNVTAAALAINGTSGNNGAAGVYGISSRLPGSGIVTVSVATIFELRVRQNNANGLGIAMTDGRSEIYARIEITKLS